VPLDRGVVRVKIFAVHAAIAVVTQTDAIEMMLFPAPAGCSALTSHDAWHTGHGRGALGVTLVAVEHLGEETRPVKPDRRAVHVHAQVVVAVTNGITTARAIIPRSY
jgi:hypothetical protein